MAVLQDVNINVYAQPSEKRVRTFLALSQNENGRQICFRILGAPLPSNCSATFSGTKPDGTVYTTTGTVAGNFVIVQEDMQMTAVPGVWDATLDVVNGTHNIVTAIIRVMVERGTVAPGSVPSNSQLDGYVAQCKSYAEQARMEAYGSPLTAETKAQMTDHKRAYVYTGSEPNMVAGNWYYWNGSAWTSGGVYNAVAVQTDKTLTVQDKAADGKATGDALNALKEDLNTVEDAVFDIEYIPQECPNLYEDASEDMHLTWTSGVFGSSENSYGFYIPISDYVGEEIVITRRTKKCDTLRGGFASEIPAVGVAYNNAWNTYGSPKFVTVPTGAKYIYITYYNASSDTNTKQEALESILVAKATQKNLRDESTLATLYHNNGVLAESSSLHGFYVAVDKTISPRVHIAQSSLGTRLRYVFTSEVPAVGVTAMNYTDIDAAYTWIADIPDDANYLYVMYYSSSADTDTTREARYEAIKVRYPIPDIEYVPSSISRLIKIIGDVIDLQSDKIDTDQGATNVGKVLTVGSDGNVSPQDVTVKVDRTLSVPDDAADSASVGNQIFSKHTRNLFDDKTDINLQFASGTYASSENGKGFYVPIDSSKGTSITISRSNVGARFRFGLSANAPATGVTYDSYIDRDSSTSYTITGLTTSQKYLYVLYYNQTVDTLTQQECLVGMKIYYGTSYEARESRIDRLDYGREIVFENGNIDSIGDYVSDNKSIVSNGIRTNGRFGVSCPSDYVMTVHRYDFDGVYTGSVSVSDTVTYPTHYGYIRICIADSEESDITIDNVDFSQIKMPRNRYSPATYTDHASYVLDAENCTTQDVYEYYDKAMQTHNMYVSKTFLCNEEGGRPINYYTLGSGSKKLCLVTGQHGPGSGGDPRDSVITVAKLMHDLITGNFEHGSFLQKLHDEYTILVFPVLNPFGFDVRNRRNYNSIDTNRDWQTQATVATQYAKPVITAFNPIIAIDVHCNGSTMLAIPNIGIEFMFGATHNAPFEAAIEPYTRSYYNSNANARTVTAQDTSILSHVILYEMGILGGLIEMRWWLKDSKVMHNAQAESLNYATLVNAIKYFDAVYTNTEFVFEHTPNQNQY